MNEIIEKEDTKLNVNIKRKLDDPNEPNKDHGKALLETIKTEDVYDLANINSYSTNVGRIIEHIGEMPIIKNEVGCSDEQGEYMNWDSGNKKEESDDHECVEIGMEENNLNYKLLEVVKDEDVKHMITDDISSRTHFKNKHNQEVESHRCQHCTFETKSEHHLQKHFKLKHADPAVWYQCGFCEYRTMFQDYLKSHFKNKHDHDVEWHQCQYCMFKTKRKQNLKLHFKHKHDDTAGWCHCKLCEYRTKIKANLKKHFEKMHNQDVEWHHCQLCEYRTKYEHSLKKHFENRHSQDVEWHQCQRCTFKTTSEELLKSHLECEHDTTAWHDCQYCPFKTKNERFLELHFKYYHDNTHLNNVSDTEEGKLDIEELVMDNDNCAQNLNSAEVTRKDGAEASVSV